MCISSGIFQKKHIFQKDFLQAGKPGRGRELTKDRPYIHMYERLCKFCQARRVPTGTCNFPSSEYLSWAPFYSNDAQWMALVPLMSMSWLATYTVEQIETLGWWEGKANVVNQTHTVK